jgi:Ca-activated chloride channel family protein
MLQFTYPWLFLLLPLPLLVRRLVPAYSEPRLAVRVPFMDKLHRLTGNRDSEGPPLIRRTRIQWVQLTLIWLALVAAAARPVWMEEPLVQELPMRDLLVALDLSGSMETADFTDPQDRQTTRLDAAQSVLDEFLSRRDGDRVGLVFFGSAAFVQAPFTSDLDVVRELLGEAQVRMLGPRTMMGDAIGVAIRLFERSEVEERVLIVLTDGNDTGSMVPPVRAAEIARDSGVVIHTVAMGDPAAVGEQMLDEATLKEVAAVTGGEFFHADNREQLQQIYTTLDQLNPRQVETRSYSPQNDLFYWPFTFALLVSLLLFSVAEIRNALARRRLDKRLEAQGDAA